MPHTTPRAADNWVAYCQAYSLYIVHQRDTDMSIVHADDILDPDTNTATQALTIQVSMLCLYFSCVLACDSEPFFAFDWRLRAGFFGRSRAHACGLRRFLAASPCRSG